MNDSKPWIVETLAEQRKWMEERGTTLDGYIEFYKKSRTPTDIATKIFFADQGALLRLEQQCEPQTQAVIIFADGVSKQDAEQMLINLKDTLKIKSFHVSIQYPEMEQS